LTVRRLSRPGLEPVDLDLAAGECVALSGPSGAGKSLLLRAIADLDPNQGAVGLDGDDRDAMPAPEWRRRVTYVATESGWWAEAVGAHFDDRVAAVDQIQRLALAAEAVDWPVARLSTGERRRLALARALLRGPRVLLLDEPTSGLDDAAADAVEAQLRQRLADGVGILVITHDAAQADRLAGRRLSMRDGRLGDGDGAGAA
jgi:phosphate-transporting ATPase